MTTHSDPPWPACTFSIGGLGLAVECSDAALVEGLSSRYQGFAGGTTPHLTARVQLEDSPRCAASLEASLIFSGELTRFSAPGGEGGIDEKQGRAWLALASTRPLEDVDYFLRVACALLAFRQGGLMFHAAGIARGGRGHVFFGYSGSGKTTVARLSPDAVVLNDDLLLLMPSAQGWTVHATPFWNPTQVNPAGASSAPLANMFRLVQDKQVYLEEMGAGQALAEVIASVPVISTDPSRLGDLIERARRLIAAVPVYRLHFLPDTSFWRVVEQARAA